MVMEHGGGLGLPAIRWWWLIRLIRWWWWLIRPGRERPTPRSRPGRERPTPRPGLAVPDPNGLEVTRADLGLDERDPRHGLGSPSPIPAGLEIVPFENQIAAALGASLGHHRRGGFWCCHGGLGLCRGLGWLNRWLEVDFVYWVCCGWVFGGGGWAVVGFSVVVVGLWLGFRWWWFFGGWACRRGLGLEVDFVGFGLEVDGGAVDSAWWLVTGMSLVAVRN
uniref:Uncharacterized protein n=1 Tax=Fagus sylvatica TaxID=28930 RepID=A0A2N9I9K9_FAGSY